MSEHGILFSAAMVRAILSGAKSQTRRAITRRNCRAVSQAGKRFMLTASEWDSIYWDGAVIADNRVIVYGGDVAVRVTYLLEPIWHAGDVLYAKETFQTGEYALNDPQGTVYRATDPDWSTQEGWQWKPSIFMPRDLARIVTPIVSVRAARLHDITEDDAIAEGCTMLSGSDDGSNIITRTYRRGYRELWNSINGHGSWEANSIVWRIKFQPHKP
jgi:hypothetical protein